MSLYGLQKFLFDFNRQEDVRSAFFGSQGFSDAYELSDEEQKALLDRDIGLIYVLGANGQLLMHFAAFCGFGWSNYLEAMREGVRKHGPVRAGVYAMTSRTDEKVAGL